MKKDKIWKLFNGNKSGVFNFKEQLPPVKMMFILILQIKMGKLFRNKIMKFNLFSNDIKQCDGQDCIYIIRFKSQKNPEQIFFTQIQEKLVRNKEFQEYVELQLNTNYQIIAINYGLQQFIQKNNKDQSPITRIITPQETLMSLYQTDDESVIKEEKLEENKEEQKEQTFFQKYFYYIVFGMVVYTMVTKKDDDPQQQ